MHLIITVVDFLHLDDGAVADLAHKVAGAGDLPKLHLFIFEDGLAKAGLSGRLVHQETRPTVQVALAIDLHHVVELQHVLRCALPRKVFVV